MDTMYEIEEPGKEICLNKYDLGCHPGDLPATTLVILIKEELFY